MHLFVGGWVINILTMNRTIFPLQFYDLGESRYLNAVVKLVYEPLNTPLDSVSDSQTSKIFYFHSLYPLCTCAKCGFGLSWDCVVQSSDPSWHIVWIGTIIGLCCAILRSYSFCTTNLRLHF